MKTAYEILGIKTDANDVEIKQAYLQHVKDNPPDHDQQQFQLIHEAYSAIKDLKSRIDYELFTLPKTDFNALIDIALKPEQVTNINPESLQKLLNSSIDNADLLSAMTTLEQQ